MNASVVKSALAMTFEGKRMDLHTDVTSVSYSYSKITCHFRKITSFLFAWWNNVIMSKSRQKGTNEKIEYYFFVIYFRLNIFFFDESSYRIDKFRDVLNRIFKTIHLKPIFDRIIKHLWRRVILFIRQRNYLWIDHNRCSWDKHHIWFISLFMIESFITVGFITGN